MKRLKGDKAEYYDSLFVLPPIGVVEIPALWLLAP